MKIDWKLLCFFITTVLGGGAIWQYQEAQVNKSHYELVKATKSVELREKLDSLMERIISTTSEFEHLNLCNQPLNQATNKALEVHARLNLLKESFSSIEKELAEIEQRSPRDISLEFSAPCPVSIGVQVQIQNTELK